MQFYLRNSRFGTIVHSLLYLFGIPVFFGDYNNLNDSDSREGILRDYGLLVNISNTTTDNLSSLLTGGEKSLDTEKCFEPWGCFKPKFRLFPDTIQDMNPTVCLYTMPKKITSKNGCDSCQIVDNETLRQLQHLERPAAASVINNVSSIRGGQSYWIVHGYMENGNRPWIKEMACEILAQDAKANVFVVDWAEAAKPPYTQAVANLELLAVYSARIMRDLQELYSLDYKNVHLIGHSLGAHLAGFIGTWVKDHLNETVGRISGLDPAQPHFQEVPPDGRLGFEDANFVDIIHTDARPMLDGGNVGHADFYPNNGREQPGCKDGVYNAILLEDGSFLYGIRRFLGCDHMRAYEYFTESVRSHRVDSCKFMGFACSSWDQFSSARCNTSLVPINWMGFNAVKPSEGTMISYYLVTSSKSPFCRNHYVVTLNLAQESSYRSTSELHLVLGDPAEGDTATLTIDWTELRGGNLTYTYLREGPHISGMKKLVLRPAMSNPLLWWVNRMGPKTPDLSLTSISIKHLEPNVKRGEDSKIIFCPVGSPFFSISDQNPHIELMPADNNSQTCA
ncbi:pancreatic triacylglycerol lipase isoform X2 [Folsomia candida]|uniref:pancreatic triacylglycerol lipase isoform X2 n=1 Tax=Folsomia candida TaxID=158441 RepID=UPI0016051DF7|nr:pancreatic triacylglycerol lipase isoform X2 [Folsomia candida]